MKNLWKKSRIFMCAVLMAAFCFGAQVSAEEAATVGMTDLGITNEGYTIDPAYSVSVGEYDVKVQEGTVSLNLQPAVTDGYSTSVTDNVLENGSKQIGVTVTDADGNIVGGYVLNVSEDPELGTAQESEGVAAAVTEAPVTEAPVTEAAVTEAETAAAAAVTEAATETKANTDSGITVNTGSAAQELVETANARILAAQKNVNMLMWIVYALIGFAVILLIALINLILKNKELKTDVKELDSMLKAVKSTEKQDKKAKTKGKSSNNIRPLPPKKFTGMKNPNSEVNQEYYPDPEKDIEKEMIQGNTVFRNTAPQVDKNAKSNKVASTAAEAVKTTAADEIEKVAKEAPEVVDRGIDMTEETVTNTGERRAAREAARAASATQKASASKVDVDIVDL